jgi:hypothetical protein
VEQTPIILFVLLAGIMPLVWGWTVHWVMSRLWPPPVSARRTAPVRSTPPLDYQI